jgi:hypothetical protein
MSESKDCRLYTGSFIIARSRLIITLSLYFYQSPFSVAYQHKYWSWFHISMLQISQGSTSSSINVLNLLLYAFYWVIPSRLNFICQRFGTVCLFHLYMTMRLGQCSETSAYKILTPGNYPEGSIQHSEHGESLQSSVKLHVYVLY